MTISEADKQQYLSKHLPYRINMMLAQAMMERRIKRQHIPEISLNEIWWHNEVEKHQLS